MFTLRSRILTVGILGIFLFVGSGAQAFAQVSGSQNPYADAYAYLAAAELIPTADTINAGQIISRGEVIRILVDVRPDTEQHMQALRGHLSQLPLFVDVSRDDWVAPYAEAAFDAGITSGFPDRTLRPNDPIPAEEAIGLVMRGYEIPGEAQGSNEEWFAPLVRAALTRNIIADPQSMIVGQPITRGQFYDMVYRADVVARQSLDAFGDHMMIPDSSSSSSVMPSSSSDAQEASSAPSSATVSSDQQQVVMPPQQESSSAQEQIQMPSSAPVQQQPVQQPAPAQQNVAPYAPVMPAQPADSGSVLQYASQKNFAIAIPELGIKDLTISDPADAHTSEGLLVPLQIGVGHLFSYPGTGGKIMIYGHSSGYVWDPSKYTKIFTQVNKLKPGNLVYVTYNGTLYVYSVTGQQTISPTDTTPFQGTGEELILYTCWPPNSIKHRLIVRASPVEQVALR